MVCIEEQEQQEKPKVLIVDDIRASYSLLSAVMDTEYRLFYAASGLEALSTAAEEQPDLIILDVEMPNMDGYEVCKHLKDNPETAHIPVIFVTARTDVKEEEWGLRLGAVDYIHKPFHPSLVYLRARLHLTLKQQRDALEQLARIDCLTLTTNRHAFNIGLDEELLKAYENQESIALLMIDVDHFKRYNDRHGHLVGDECLRLIAAALKTCVDRESDMVARYGGEEFSIMLSDIERATKIGARVVDAVRTLHPPGEDKELTLKPQITVSVGVAAVVPDESFSPVSLIDLADQALYQAKEEGRDRMVVSGIE